MLGGLKRCLPEPLRRVARLFLAESDARYHLAWNLYGRLARLFCRSGGHADDRRQFSRFGYIEGTVPEDQLARLMASLQDLPTIGWTAEDCAPGYVADSSLEKIAEVYNRNHPHLRLDPESLSLIEQILGSISERVRSAMGCSWPAASLPRHVRSRGAEHLAQRPNADLNQQDSLLFDTTRHRIRHDRIGDVRRHNANDYGAGRTLVPVQKLAGRPSRPAADAWRSDDPGSDNRAGLSHGRHAVLSGNQHAIPQTSVGSTKSELTPSLELGGGLGF